MIDKRKNEAISDVDLYKLNNIDEAIKKERRFDELGRLNEVMVQKKVWLTVVGISATINATFLLLAMFGGK